MNPVTKALIPDKEWLVKDNETKIGSIAKDKKGYVFLKNGIKINFKDLTEIKTQIGITSFDEWPKKSKSDTQTTKNYTIYDFACSSKPYDPVYSLKKKLPLFAKSDKSKSQYCAGYYVIKFRKGWVKSFCPKLITLERYPYHGPFKTEAEMKSVLNTINKS